MLGVEWEGSLQPSCRGDGQEQKETPKEGPSPGTKGLSRVMWVEIGRWGNVEEGGSGLDEFCPRNAGGLRVPGSGFLKVSSSGTLGFSQDSQGRRSQGWKFHGPLSGSVRARPTRSKVGFSAAPL